MSDRTFDFDKLYEVTKVVTKDLNKIFDINYYPIPEVISFTLIFSDFFNLKA